MPPLIPAELIHRIIVLSLPSTISFEALPARYALLRSYSLVSRSWTPWAQLELYRHVLLRGEEGVLTLAASTEGRDDLLEQVESLRAYRYGYENVQETLPPLLARCSHLYDLRLDMGRCSLEMLKLVPTLRQLSLRDGALDLVAEPNKLASESLLLPLLSSLSLVESVKTGGEWSTLINPQTLPALANLSIATQYTSRSVGEVEEFARSFSIVAPQIKSFSLRAPSDRLSRHLAPRIVDFTKLENLTIRRHLSASTQSPFLRSALVNLPSPLRRLRITAPEDPELENEGCSLSAIEFDLDALTAALRDPTIHSTSSLARVVLPDMERLCRSCSLDLPDTMRELDELVHGRECDLERAAAEESDFGDRKTYLDEW
ncbi:hypothetical protein BCR35DRAFT_353980 [Leucosporidium creatinivorum]|uniref:F-box domain-containing protein n=1 Tax=Leucosporidium creatinivorum TaxID=106004 RepID=A0A1Y2ER68_9BASI|nr:hypothetical protein BCR35DRAFT_353980 [Leucosporidium creatinivorum]